MVPFSARRHRQAVASATIIVMNESLQQHLDSLARDECYRVDAVLKEGGLERTERVFFVGANGAEQGPYVRKVFDAESGLGAAYGRVLEAQRQGKRFLHLPRIIDCYSLGEQDVVVMEFVVGRTLADEVYEAGPSLDAANRLFPGICDAIAELHTRFDPPLIHRDIKPSNFMVEGDTVLVIDLGIARTYDKDAVCDTSHFGTRAYAPPEQFGYGQTDVRSDVYALGMLLFYLLCEETPVPSTVQKRLCAHGVPRSVRDVVAQATAFDPADRFGSVGAMRAAFMYAVGVPVDFRRGGLSLLIRVVRGALAIFGVAIRLPKQVARKIPDSSLVSDWMVLYGPAALGMPPIRITPALRLVRQSRLCRPQRPVHLRCATPKSGEDSRLLRMAQKPPFDGCGGLARVLRAACLWAWRWLGISCWPPGAWLWPSRALPPA